MSKEQDLHEEILAEMSDYHEKANIYNRIQEKEHSDRIKELKLKLSAHLSKGAVNHPKCGLKPDGMKKRDAIMVGDRIDRNPIYIVICHKCGVYHEGSSAKEAVAKWNHHQNKK
jgi:hypothetical protein